jgi:hypothetical protein
MARPVFTPPPDDDDVIDVLAGRAPIYKPSPPKADATVPQPAPNEPTNPRGAARTPPESASAMGERAIPTRQASPLPPAAKALRRVGLYLDLEQWARLNELQIERARRSLPHDYTAIVLEALEAHYGNFGRRRS